MCTHAYCPQSWWEFSFETAIHVYNRTLLRRTNWSTPFENLTSKKPDVHYLKTFGCLSWVYIPKEMRKHKLDPRSKQITFVGYEIGSKAYKFMCKDNSIFVAAHALFNKNTFPRAKNENGFQTKNKLLVCPPENMDHEEFIIPKSKDTNDHSQDPDRDSNSDKKSEESNSESGDEEDEVDSLLKSSRNHSREHSIHSLDEKSEDGDGDGYQSAQGPENEPDLPGSIIEPTPEPKELRRSSQAPKLIIRSDNVYGAKPATQIEKEIWTESGWQKAMKPSTSLVIKQFHLTVKENLEELLKQGGNKFTQFLLAQAITMEKNPKEMQFRDILVIKGRDPIAFNEWWKAMEAEIQALNDCDVWELMNLPPDRKPIKCRWVYNVKTDGRKQGHLVTKGFSQIPGIDFEETFSPVARFETVRLLLALSVLEDWEIKAIDVKTAFLYGNLDEELYMEQPEGFIIKGQETKVYHLKKALYGLKQASLAWNKQADKSLKTIGFQRCRSDTGVYIQIKNNNILVVDLDVHDD